MSFYSVDLVYTSIMRKHSQEQLGPDPVFILGADDPEMRRVREILEEEKLPYVLAEHGGERVTVRTAYIAEHVGSLATSCSVYFVECKVDGIVPYRILDHHNPGDPGYDLPAVESWRASSLGQLCTLLDREPEHSDLVLAAMDHNFPAAYRGEVPGVTPDDVLSLRIQENGEQSGVSITKFGALVNSLQQTIEKKCTDKTNMVQLGESPVLDMRDFDTGLVYSPTYLALQVALVQMNVAALLTTANSGKDKAKKIILTGCGTSSNVEAFFNEFGPSIGLSGIYGSKTRGYAGGYDYRE